jgi:hypothetical protein
VADDHDVAAFVAGMPVTQPNLFFAAVQFLTGPDGVPATGPELRSLVKTRDEEIAALMRARRTQTNEVGRCAVLLPALPAGPLAVVEVGASAGLCLLLDRFCYEFGSTLVGDPSSPVHLSCMVSGAVPLPAALPRIVWRRGLDLRPVDVNDDDAVRWLIACVWPEHQGRRRRLEAAIAIARAEAPVVTRGDLVDDLADVLAEAPDAGQLVVFHSAVLSYVSVERRRLFAGVLAEVAKRRPVVWLSNEAHGVVSEIAALAPPPTDELRFLLGRTRFTEAGRHHELLALSHPHGGRLTWL